ncbi:TIGR01777 family oxidoreductase [Pontiella agarivorans]|uniref:TIGR01777 family oxidoreductase n=1 Tax=Pontiella agarivorans TaxID=3038953 RepID=A0ABU5MWH2_9BACT|nr:TIGR01777 family oxidoreductase [Pontiella agarivorans]MDZ8118579.1 TIGR01777 family oxidoreductase [Pontiella agarivorans]
MKVLISGSHGLIGTALVTQFTESGHEIQRLGRNLSEPLNMEGVNAVIHLAGENIAQGRWNDKKKKTIRESRVAGTKALSEQIAQSKHKPRVFISGSAIGYYGDRGDIKLDEKSSPGSGFLPDVCEEWENCTHAASDAGVRTVQLRTGIVLSNQGGALRKMLPPFKMGGGGVLGNGNQYMSWISIEDMVGAILHIIEHEEISGAVNMVAPTPHTNKEFTKALGKVLKRPTIMPMPAFAARLLFGEMADALLLSSTRVIPTVLLHSEYTFKHPDLESALKAVLI